MGTPEIPKSPLNFLTTPLTAEFPLTLKTDSFTSLKQTVQKRQNLPVWSPFEMRYVQNTILGYKSSFRLWRKYCRERVDESFMCRAESSDVPRSSSRPFYLCSVRKINSGGWLHRMWVVKVESIERNLLKLKPMGLLWFGFNGPDERNRDGVKDILRGQYLRQWSTLSSSTA